MPELPSRPRGVLIDLAGVIHVGDRALPGAIDALARLRAAKLPLRFLTNTTRSPRASVVGKLQAMGLGIAPDEVMTAVHATHQYVQRHHLHPWLLIHPDIAAEMGPSAAAPDAVVLGDAADGFSFAAMNQAFRLLKQGLPLIAMARNRFFQETDGLTIDMGAFVTALEYAADVQATIIGKPAAAFFGAALGELGIGAQEAVMIGDDLRDDVQGAQACGVAAMLVRTGKYRPADEQAAGERPALVCDDFAAAVTAILARV
ncbi:TIGR01458 family HAD-type hydrolase [Uliginosibacterium aquaticum]|uniref:Phospholysine phosphohistidine inorganic pyrophosphate phosphatase n=1 Tax=Uliginosibacterium aquaticum TaxID=2731212 RepID=A0ABX2ID02_9RHOO|nr:TIGR01458 family HAD-type hydrolase [Uliginosibacterium aquaticum]NSL54336.1 TIGR01458 family HAD-type hydrolase [Uliginosibacterium aquaticum]